MADQNKRSAKFREIVIVGAILGGMLSVLVIGEIRYSRRIEPTGVQTIADHMERFGPPQFVYEVRWGGPVHYELNGFPDSQVPKFALPSSAPSYVYDGQGKLVDWCPDPGDDPRHRGKWSRGRAVEFDELRRRFDLPPPVQAADSD